jgi:hypothetical protein
MLARMSARCQQVLPDSSHTHQIQPTRFNHPSHTVSMDVKRDVSTDVSTDVNTDASTNVSTDVSTDASGVLRTSVSSSARLCCAVLCATVQRLIRVKCVVPHPRASSAHNTHVHIWYITPTYTVGHTMDQNFHPSTSLGVVMGASALRWWRSR